MAVRTAVLMVCLLIGLFPAVSAGQKELHVSLETPYSLGNPFSCVKPGERFQARVSLENYAMTACQADVSVELPAGFSAYELPPGWHASVKNGRTVLSAVRDLSGGYGHWFDLVSIQCGPDVEQGNYAVKIYAASSREQDAKEVILPVRGERQAAAAGSLSFDRVLAPLDEDGNADVRVNAGTIVLRDSAADYYKSLLKGKGAINTVAESFHPVTYMGLDLKNPQAQQKLLVITAQLLDKNTRQPVPGLFTPDSGMEAGESGGFSGRRGVLAAFAALSGVVRQRLVVPVYADEQVLRGGEYILQVAVQEGSSPALVRELPLTVIKQNTKAGLVTAAAALVIAVALPLLLSRRKLLTRLKTRWLVTTALFGAAAFAVVNVPNAFLNDFFHVVLGPFSFLVTGMYHGIVLYMLLISLVTLAPRPGVVSLMTLVRMLISMLVFGHVSPVSIFLYGSQAVCLEACLYAAGITRQKSSGHFAGGGKAAIALVAVMSGLADALSTYVNLQAMSFLYRLFYADWYIYICVLISGFIYPAVGAACGALLGRELKKVGVD